MIAIAVDDEALMLGALVSAIEASPDISGSCEKLYLFISRPPLRFLCYQ